MIPAVWPPVSFALSACGTRVLWRYATSRGLYDRPNDRSSHTVLTPRLGGIAVAVATLVGWTGVTASADTAVAPAMHIALGGAVAALVGLVDDLRDVSPPVKLAGEILAASVPLLLWYPALTFVAQLIVAVWLLSYLNFFNFMDGSDGLAGGVAVLTALGLWVLAIEVRAESAQWMALVTAAAAAGFLVFNFPPASMFMGDTGSLFLGYTLGVLAVAVWLAGASIVSTGLILSPFIFDAGFTLAVRVSNREAIWRAHRSHLYQRLLRSGASHLRVAALYWCWSFVSIVLGYAWSHSSIQARPWLALLSLIPGSVLFVYVRRRERQTVQQGAIEVG